EDGEEPRRGDSREAVRRVLLEEGGEGPLRPLEIPDLEAAGHDAVQDARAVLDPIDVFPEVALEGGEDRLEGLLPRGAGGLLARLPIADRRGEEVRLGEGLPAPGDPRAVRLRVRGVPGGPPVVVEEAERLLDVAPVVGEHPLAHEGALVPFAPRAD